MQKNSLNTRLQSLVDSCLEKLNECTIQIKNLHSLIEKASAIKRGDSVSWNSSGGTAKGKVTKIITSGSEQVPGSSFTITGTKEDPAALIRVYRPDTSGDYKPTDTIVGHKVSTLTKITDLD